MGDDDVPTGPALDAARVLDGGHPRLHLAAGEPDHDDVGLGVRRGQRQRLAAGRRPPTGERGQGGQAETDEGPAVELHACITAPGARQVPAQSAASTTTLASSRSGPSDVVATASRIAEAAAMADGAAIARRARRRPSSPKTPPSGAVRSRTPSETSTTSSSGAIVVDAVRVGGSRRSSPRTG